MSAPDNKDKKKPPQWSIFDRLDEVEGITLELMDKVKDTETAKSLLNDAYVVALTALGYAFASSVVLAPSNLQTRRDAILASFKNLGVSENTLAITKGILIEIRKSAEN